MQRIILNIIFSLSIVSLISGCGSSSSGGIQSNKSEISGLWRYEPPETANNSTTNYLDLAFSNSENQIAFYETSEDDLNCFYRVEAKLNELGGTSYSYENNVGNTKTTFVFDLNNVEQGKMSFQFTDRNDDDDDGDISETIELTYTRVENLEPVDIPLCS